VLATGAAIMSAYWCRGSMLAKTGANSSGLAGSSVSANASSNIWRADRCYPLRHRHCQAEPAVKLILASLRAMALDSYFADSFPFFRRERVELAVPTRHWKRQQK